MKFILFISFFLLLSYANAQNNQLRIQQIDNEIKMAADKGDYELAASLKKEKELLIQIDQAVNEGNYEKAADLKKKLSTLPSAKKSQIAELQKQIDAEVVAGNYEKAAELKKQIENIKSGKISAETEQNNSTVRNDKVLKPEFMNQVYVLNQESSILNRLEKKEGEIKTSTTAAPFYASSTSYYYISGNNSAIEVKSNARFIVEMYEGVDPAEQLKLVRFDADKRGNDRYMPYFKAEGYGYGGSSSGKVDDNSISLQFKRLEGNIFEIIPDNTLSNGEYGFMYINKFYCFRKGPIMAFSGTKKLNSFGANTDYMLKSGFYTNSWIGVSSAAIVTNNNSSGIGVVADVGPSFGLTLGNKWYFGNNSRYRPGFGVAWFKLGIDMIDVTNPEAWIVNTSLLNVGFTNVYTFNEILGLEANFFLGFNAMLVGLEDPYLGVTINTNIQLKYKYSSFGIEYAYKYGTFEDNSSNSFISPSAVMSTVAFVVSRKFGKKNR